MTLTRVDLPDLLYNVIKELNGSCTIVEACKYIWENYKDKLESSGSLFYTWQYDIRWAATTLRKTNRMKDYKISPTGVWQIVT